MDYHMPGNIRELKGILDYLDIISDSVAGYYEFCSYGIKSINKSNENYVEKDNLKYHVIEFEKSIINRAIESLGSKRAAARALGIDIATLIRKQQKV